MPTDSEIIVQGLIMDIIHRSVKEANPIYEDIPVASGLENQDKLAYLVENCVLDNCFVVEDEKEIRDLLIEEFKDQYQICLIEVYNTGLNIHTN